MTVSYYCPWCWLAAAVPYSTVVTANGRVGVVALMVCCI